MAKFSKTVTVILLLIILASCSNPIGNSQTWNRSDLEQLISTWREQAGIPEVVVRAYAS